MQRRSLHIFIANCSLPTFFRSSRHLAAVVVSGYPGTNVLPLGSATFISIH